MSDDASCHQPPPKHPNITIVTQPHPDSCKCAECCTSVVEAINNLASKFDVTATDIAIYISTVQKMGPIINLQAQFNVAFKIVLGVTFTWTITATLLSDGDPEAIQLPLLLLALEFIAWAGLSIWNQLRVVVSVPARVAAMGIVVVTTLHAISTAPRLLGWLCGSHGH